LVAADAVTAMLKTMAADSANIALIDIFPLLVRSGVIAALLSTQTPAASDHSINRELSAMMRTDPCILNSWVGHFAAPRHQAGRSG
jgi:hypothetical protein